MHSLWTIEFKAKAKDNVSCADIQYLSRSPSNAYCY